MSKLSQLLNNEELLTKAVKAETKEEAKGVLKEGGLEVNDAELEEIAGGMSKTAKVVLGVLGGATAAAAAGVGGYYLLKRKEAKEELANMKAHPNNGVKPEAFMGAGRKENLKHISKTGPLKKDGTF